MPQIFSIHAREILDSRGSPTLEVEVKTTSGAIGIASVPSGASKGSKEAFELRDKDMKRYQGKGVTKSIQLIENEIQPLLKNCSVLNQTLCDTHMMAADGSVDKKKWGANTMLAVSLAIARAASNYLHLPLYQYLGGCFRVELPCPMMNIVNGGVHADSGLDIQECMIVPLGISCFEDKIRAGAEIFSALKEILKQKKYATSVGDEGGFAPNVQSNEEALDLILQAITQANYKAGKDVFLALDVAASSFYDRKKKVYVFSRSKQAHKTTEEMILWYHSLLANYPIISLEDPLDEKDYEGWKSLTLQLGNRCLIVGDDLFVTHLDLLKAGVQHRYANSILLKPNQIGTLTETVEVAKYAQKNGFTTILSHRSGETEDSFISDLSVALSTAFIKAGSLSRSERLAKYNRLLKIAQENR